MGGLGGTKNCRSKYKDVLACFHALCLLKGVWDMPKPPLLRNFKFGYFEIAACAIWKLKSVMYNVVHYNYLASKVGGGVFFSHVQGIKAPWQASKCKLKKVFINFFQAWKLIGTWQYSIVLMHFNSIIIYSLILYQCG